VHAPDWPTHVLRDVPNERLQARIQLQLNRGEFRHNLARCLFFANRGVFRNGDCAEIMASGVATVGAVRLPVLFTRPLRGSLRNLRDDDVAWLQLRQEIAGRITGLQARAVAPGHRSGLVRRIRVR
jgi:hypothetical protein